METNYSMSMVQNNFLLENSFIIVRKLKSIKPLIHFLYLPDSVQKMSYLNEKDNNIKNSGYVILKLPRWKINNINDTFKFMRNNKKISNLLECITHGFEILNLLHTNNIIHNNINSTNLVTNRFNFLYIKDFRCAIDLSRPINYHILKQGNIPFEFKILLDNKKNKVLPNENLIQKLTQNTNYFSNIQDNQEYSKRIKKYFSEIEIEDEIDFIDYLKIVDIFNFTYVMLSIIENNFVINDFIEEVKNFLFEILCPPYCSNASEIMYSFKDQYINWCNQYLTKKNLLNY